jgi:hypothetical protein
MTKKFITYRTTAGTSASLVTTRSIYRSFSGLRKYTSFVGVDRDSKVPIPQPVSTDKKKKIII